MTLKQEEEVNNFGKNLILLLFLFLNFFAFLNYNSTITIKEVATNQIEVMDSEKTIISKTSSISILPSSINFRFN